MSLFTKQTHRLREWTYGYGGAGGLTCTQYYIQNK